MLLLSNSHMRSQNQPGELCRNFEVAKMPVELHDLQKFFDVFNFGLLKGPKIITSEIFCVRKFKRPTLYFYTEIYKHEKI